MSDSRTYSNLKMKKKIVRQNKVILFLSCVLVAFLGSYLLRSPDFTQTQDYTLFLLFLSIGLWITEAIPPFAVAILIVGFLVFSMGNNPEVDVNNYVSTWSDGVIWLFLGGFFIAEGLKKTKLDESIMAWMLPKLGTSAERILLGIMMMTGVLSMMMSNTACTALVLATLMPIGTLLGEKSNLMKSLLLGIPAAASFGGMGTIIGSAPNAIAVGALSGMGIQISFIEWMIIGTPSALVLIFVFYLFLRKKYELKGTHVDPSILTFGSNNVELDAEQKIQRRIVLAITSITMLFWFTSEWTKIPVAAISGIPIVLYTMLGIINADDVRALHWDTLMLVAGGLSLGLAIKEQGIVAYFISNIEVVNLNPILLVLIFSLATVSISNFMSNTAAATIVIPIGISLLSITSGLDEAIMPICIGLAASCALLLPISTPPNALAYSTGLIEQKEFYPGGILSAIIGPFIIMLFTLAYFFI